MIPGVVASHTAWLSSVVPGYWIATLGGAGIELTAVANNVAIASDGSIYVAGYTASQGAGGDDLLIAKYNSAGVIQWQRSLGGAAADRGNAVAVDAGGSVYVVGYTASQGAGGNDLLIAKYNSAGAIQWQRSLGGSGTETALSVAVASDGSVYICGQTDTGGLDALVAKYNSAGVIQWQRGIGGASAEQGYGVSVASDGSVYITGYTTSQGPGSGEAIIAKYSAAGAIQWQRILGGTGAERGYGVSVASDGSVYITGYTASQGAGGNDLLIAKYNSAGVIQWQRSLGGSGVDSGIGIHAASDGSVYVVGYTASQGAGGDDLLIVKYNSAGVIQWQRSLGGSVADRGAGVAVTSDNSIVVTGYTDSAGAGLSDLLIARLPSDGGLTGTYGPFTYAATTLTDAATSLTDAAGTLTDAAKSLTDAARTLTDAPTTLTNSVTQL